jgi:hypothetical protein
MAAGIALVLVMSLATAASAKPPGSTTDVSGAWTWVNSSYTITNMFEGPGPGDTLFAGDEVGTWTGTFEGQSYDVFEMTFAPPNGPEDLEVFGAAWGTLTATFTGRVSGKNGSMTMWITIREPKNSWVMTGTWTILSATEALKGISGTGTWVSSGIDSSATYAGTVTWT